MRILILIIAVMSFIAPTMAVAAEGNPDAGKTKAEQAGCMGCHGTDGVATRSGVTIDKNVPNLAGEPDLYLQFQLVFFRKGVRKNGVMSAMAAPLSDEDIRNLSAFYARMPPPNPPLPPDPAPEETQAGENLTRAIHCTTCHGDNFQGVDNIGRLAGQREDYLYKALHDFKSGARVATGAAGMADVVYPLGDPEMKALAHYLSRLQ